MGTNSHFSGSIEMDPPLKWAEVREAHELPLIKAETMPNDARNVHVLLAVNQLHEETDQGTNIVKVCHRIEPISAFCTAYRVQEAIQSVVDLFGDVHTFSGYIEERAEDDSWHHRFIVRDYLVRKLKPVTAWVDDE